MPTGFEARDATPTRNTNATPRHHLNDSVRHPTLQLVGYFASRRPENRGNKK